MRLALQLATTLWIGLVLGLQATSALAAKESRSQIKTYFETGDRPTEQEFVDVIDSLPDLQFDFGSLLLGHSVSTLGSAGGIGSDGAGSALRLGEGNSWNPELGILVSFQADVGIDSGWAGQSGFLPFQFEIDAGAGPALHAGYLQMSVDDASSATPFAIRISGIAYETTPDTPILITAIPEPDTAALLAIGLALLGTGRSARAGRLAAR